MARGDLQRHHRTPGVADHDRAAEPGCRATASASAATRSKPRLGGRLGAQAQRPRASKLTTRRCRVNRAASGPRCAGTTRVHGAAAGRARRPCGRSKTRTERVTHHAGDHRGGLLGMHSMADGFRSPLAPDATRGKVAIVTGGGTGVGPATALELARTGARLAICGRRREADPGRAERAGGRWARGARGPVRRARAGAGRRVPRPCGRSVRPGGRAP